MKKPVKGRRRLTRTTQVLFSELVHQTKPSRRLVVIEQPNTVIYDGEAQGFYTDCLAYDDDWTIDRVATFDDNSRKIWIVKEHCL